MLTVIISGQTLGIGKGGELVLSIKILCITHADFETPGIIEDWAKQHNYKFNICKPYLGETCLKQSVFDFLIIMGGPQSPLQLTEYPYLKEEITLIQQAIFQKKGVLGFCLGAQLIGEALGAKTARSPEKEIGVFPITLTEAGMQDAILDGFPESFPVIHWHNDMPGETEQSVLLAKSEGCPKQIVRYGALVYGFQCHLEITRNGIQALINACPEDLKTSKFTQSPEKLLQNDYNNINQYMKKILDRFASSLLLNKTYA